MDEKDLELLKKLATLKENGIIDNDELQKRKSEYFETKKEELRQKQVKEEKERKLIEEKKAQEEKRRKEEEELRIRKRQTRKQFIIIHEKLIINFIIKYKRLIISGAAIVTILLILMIHALIVSSITVYSSEDEMQDALQGTWIYSGDIEKQVIIDEDELSITYNEYGRPYYKHITWNPSKGTFETYNNKFIVKNNGTIKEGGDVYCREQN